MLPQPVCFSVLLHVRSLLGPGTLGLQHDSMVATLGGSLLGCVCVCEEGVGYQTRLTQASSAPDWLSSCHTKACGTAVPSPLRSNPTVQLRPDPARCPWSLPSPGPQPPLLTNGITRCTPLTVRRAFGTPPNYPGEAGAPSNLTPHEARTHNGRPGLSFRLSRGQGVCFPVSSRWGFRHPWR